MEKLPVEPYAAAARGAPVLGIPHHRMADGGEVGSDLVRAAGFEPDAQQRGARKTLHDLEMGYGLARPVGAGGHHRTVAPVAAERGVDRAALGVRMPLHERRVLAGD